jgi:hypothetical protein
MALGCIAAPAHPAEYRRLINHNDAYLNRESVGRRLHEVAVEAQERRDIATKCAETTHDLINRVELVFEGRDDPKVASTSAQCPEEVRILIRARVPQLPVCANHVRGNEIVTSRPKPSEEPAEPAAEPSPATPTAG